MAFFNIAYLFYLFTILTWFCSILPLHGPAGVYGTGRASLAGATTDRYVGATCRDSISTAFHYKCMQIALIEADQATQRGGTNLTTSG